MKTEKKIKFNPKSGMALPGVMVLLVVLSLLGTAMYAYGMQSVQSVRFASDGKKAEYLAQAGVEAAAYAYQVAVNNENPNTTTAVNNFFLNAKQVDGAKIESNRVWLVYDKGIKDYKYIADNGAAPTDSSYDVIGYFEVTLDETATSYKVYVRNYNTNGTYVEESDPKELPSKIKIFRAVGTVNDTKRAKTGYIEDTNTAYGLYYGPNGIIDGKYTDVSSTAPKSQATEKFIQSGSFKTSSTLQFKYKWLSLLGISDPSPISVDSETVPFALAFSAGNMVLNSPKDAKRITFAKNQSNMVSFISNNNVFVQSGVDTTSSDGCFNTLFLKGNQIVIDGDIDVSAYAFSRSSSTSLINTMSSNYQTLRDLMQRKYRYATVTIDALDQGTIPNPYNAAPYTYDRSGRIYFGGNVFVNITLPNVGTYRYRAFQAGDAYYFDADVSKVYSGDDDYTGDGIDLFRYFLEYSIATNKYSQTVLKRFSDIIDLYYGNSTTSTTDKTIQYSGTTAKGAYLNWTVTNGTTVSTGANGITYNAMRKIEVDNNGNSDYGDSLRSVIPPSPAGASALHWGEPKAED